MMRKYFKKSPTGRPSGNAHQRRKALRAVAHALALEKAKEAEAAKKA